MEPFDMMKLTFIPQFGRPEAEHFVSGETLTINGKSFDLSGITESQEVTLHPADGEDHIFVAPVKRVDGVIHATVIAWLGDDADLRQPDAPWVLDVSDGLVVLPVLRRAPESTDSQNNQIVLQDVLEKRAAARAVLKT
jgi:hypothetical protein